MRSNKIHNISGLDSVYGGSMFQDGSDPTSVMHVLDSRDDTDTYLDLAVHNVEVYGSAIVAIVEDKQAA